MPHYFQNTTVSSTVHLIDVLNTALTTEGWEVYNYNFDTSTPGTARTSYALAAKAPGKSGTIGDIPANHWIKFAYTKENVGLSGDFTVAMGVWSGGKIIPTGTIVKASSVVTVSSSSPHNLRIGDIVYVLGAQVADSYHTGWIDDDNPTVVATVPNSNTFTYFDSNGSTDIALVDFKNILVLYNPKGSFAQQNSTVPQYSFGEFTTADNPTFDIYGYCDEYRICGAFEADNTGGFKPFYIGTTGRGHIPRDWQDIGAIAADVTGTGVPQIIQLDRNCPNMAVGQPIWLVPPNEASGSKTGPQGSPSRAGVGLTLPTCSAKPTDSSIQVTLASGSQYSSGTLVGFDPCPLVVFGNNQATTNDIDLSVLDGTFAIDYNGTVASGSFTTRNARLNGFGVLELATTDVTFDLLSEVAPDGNNLFHIFDIYAMGTDVAGSTGARYPLPGWGAAGGGGTGGNGNLDQLDIIVTGRNIPENRWKAFDLIEINPLNAAFDDSVLVIGPYVNS